MTARARFTVEDDLLFTLARADLSEADQNAVIALCNLEVNWKQVYWTAVRHSIAPLVFHHLSRCPMDKLRLPLWLTTQLEGCTAANVLQREAITQEICMVLSLFISEGLDVMLCKGAALATILYEDSPWYVIPETGAFRSCESAS